MRRSRSSVMVPLFLIGIVLMMIVPVPASMLDVLLAGNLAAAVLVLMATLLFGSVRCFVRMAIGLPASNRR